MKNEVTVCNSCELQTEAIGPQIDCRDLRKIRFFVRQVRPSSKTVNRVSPPRQLTSGLLGFALHLLNRGVAYVLTFYHVDDVFGNILGVVTDALDGLGNEQDFQ